MSKMPQKCCVPGCKSNYRSSRNEGYVSIFRFPSDELVKEKWLQYIPRDKWVPNRKSVICVKHFAESDVSRLEIYKDKYGEVKSYPRSRPILQPGAVPIHFPTLHLKESVSRAVDIGKSLLVLSSHEETEHYFENDNYIINTEAESENNVIGELAESDWQKEPESSYMMLIKQEEGDEEEEGREDEQGTDRLNFNSIYDLIANEENNKNPVSEDKPVEMLQQNKPAIATWILDHCYVKSLPDQAYNEISARDFKLKSTKEIIKLTSHNPNIGIGRSSRGRVNRRQPSQGRRAQKLVVGRDGSNTADPFQSSHLSLPDGKASTVRPNDLNRNQQSLRVKNFGILREQEVSENIVGAENDTCAEEFLGSQDTFVTLSAQSQKRVNVHYLKGLNPQMGNDSSTDNLLIDEKRELNGNVDDTQNNVFNAGRGIRRASNNNYQSRRISGGVRGGRKKTQFKQLKNSEQSDGEIFAREDYLTSCPENENTLNKSSVDEFDVEKRQGSERLLRKSRAIGNSVSEKGDAIYIEASVTEDTDNALNLSPQKDSNSSVGSITSGDDSPRKRLKTDRVNVRDESWQVIQEIVQESGNVIQERGILDENDEAGHSKNRQNRGIKVVISRVQRGKRGKAATRKLSRILPCVPENYSKNGVLFSATSADSAVTFNKRSGNNISTSDSVVRLDGISVGASSSVKGKHFEDMSPRVMVKNLDANSSLINRLNECEKYREGKEQCSAPVVKIETLTTYKHEKTSLTNPLGEMTKKGTRHVISSKLNSGLDFEDDNSQGQSGPELRERQAVPGNLVSRNRSFSKGRGRVNWRRNAGHCDSLLRRIRTSEATTKVRNSVSTIVAKNGSEVTDVLSNRRITRSAEKRKLEVDNNSGGVELPSQTCAVNFEKRVTRSSAEKRDLEAGGNSGGVEFSSSTKLSSNDPGISETVRKTQNSDSHSTKIRDSALPNAGGGTVEINTKKVGTAVKIRAGASSKTTLKRGGRGKRRGKRRGSRYSQVLKEVNSKSNGEQDSSASIPPCIEDVTSIPVDSITKPVELEPAQSSDYQNKMVRGMSDITWFQSNPIIVNVRTLVNSTTVLNNSTSKFDSVSDSTDEDTCAVIVGDMEGPVISSVASLSQDTAVPYFSDMFPEENGEEMLCKTVKQEIDFNYETDDDRVLIDVVNDSPETTCDEQCTYPCPYCGTSFVDAFYAIAHTRICSRSPAKTVFSCHVCDRLYVRAEDLHAHMNTHPQELPHMCNFCGKRFLQLDFLFAHLRTHKER